MTRTLVLLALLGSIAAVPAQAADKPAEKSKSGNKVERAFDKTEKALVNTANKVEKNVKKAITKTEEAIQSAGKKTSQWIKEKVE